MSAHLVHAGRVFINFENGTFQWLDIQRFQLPGAVIDDAAALAMLVEHGLYGNDYATEPGDNPERHGPYWRNRITPDCFGLTDTDTEEVRLRGWTEQFASLPAHLRTDLERELYQPLRAADRVYRLCDLGPAAFHDWGGVHNESMNWCSSAEQAVP
jgi:hypothetical protein